MGNANFPERRRRPSVPKLAQSGPIGKKGDARCNSDATALVRVWSFSGACRQFYFSGMTEGVSTILHYTGYDEDDGGIVSVVRTLAATRQFECVLGVNPGFKQTRAPQLPTLNFPAIEGEEMGVRTFWRARTVAREVRRWLLADPRRVFHGHSRAGLAVALWLKRLGEARAVASVHCYGRQRWFYRSAARQLGDRLFWLSPAMKRHYRVRTSSNDWTQCIPGCVPVPEQKVARTGGRDAVRIGGIGSLVSWKCWHLMLDAMAKMPTLSRARLRFVHIGGPAASEKSQRYASALRAQTVGLRLEQFVEWRGSQPTAQDFLREIDALVVPSLHEPLSIAMLEALAAGVPVLASNSGGARDAITPLRDGWLFRSGDVPDLARALTMLAESDALQMARPRVEPGWRFSAPVVAAQWAQVYARVSGMQLAQRGGEKSQVAFAGVKL